MDIQTQRDEFYVRFYRWAIADAQREVQSKFPLLRSVKGSYALKTLKIMESLPREEQLKLALTLTRYAHPRALEITGELWTAEEEELWQSFIEKKRTVDTYYFDFTRQLAAGSPDLKVNRQRFKTLIEAEVIPIIGEIIENKRFECKYRLSLGGWNIDTSVKVDKREERQLVYYHSICVAGEEDVCLSKQNIQMLDCIGMGPAIWNFLTEVDTPMAVKSLVLLCSHFMGTVPNLLAGLSPPTISPQQILINKAKRDAQLLKDEFNARFYKWSLADARREVEENCGHLLKTLNVG